MLSSNVKTYNDLFKHFTSKYKNKTFLNYINNEEYSSISIIEFKNRVLCLSYALKKLGIKNNTTVAIYVDSSPFWLIFDFAIHQLGAISVPIFANISKKNLNFQIKDAGIKYIFIDDENKIKDIKNKNDLIFITHGFCKKEDNFFNYDENLTLNQTCKELSSTTYKANEDDIFSIIYTSGNTGTPKGVMLSHKNILTQIKDIDLLMKLQQEDIILSLLPLAHIFERTVMSYYLSKAASIYFVDDLKNTASLLKTVNPTTLTAVPRLIEKIFYKIKEGIKTKSFFKRVIASLAFSYAMQDNINKNSLIYKIFHKLVYLKFQEIFGNRLDKLVSGGAVLNKDIYNFFLNIGVNIYQGYGLSEFSPVVSSNYPNNNKVGSCGKLLKSAQVKFLNNEILVKGPSLMKAYLNQKELSEETIDKQGWLHTGDIGYLDKEKYLFVTSRVKDIFKTSTGEYVNALFLEQELSKNRYIEFAVVIADNKKYVSALLFINKDIYLLEKSKNANLDISTYYKNDIILQEINKHILKINKKTNTWEKIVKYEIITKDISIERGELTPSMKICRNKILELYEEEINTMY